MSASGYEYERDLVFEAAIKELPAEHWAKYDLSAVRLGWELRKQTISPKLTMTLVQRVAQKKEEFYLHFGREATRAYIGSRERRELLSLTQRPSWSRTLVGLRLYAVDADHHLEVA